MAKKIDPFKSSVTKRAEKKEKAKAEVSRKAWSEIVKQDAQPIKLKKPFKRYSKIEKSPLKRK